MCLCVCASNVSNDMPCALSEAMTKMLAATAAVCVLSRFLNHRVPPVHADIEKRLYAFMRLSHFPSPD